MPATPTDWLRDIESRYAAIPARDQRAPTPHPGGDQPEDTSKVSSIDETH